MLTRDLALGHGGPQQRGEGGFGQWSDAGEEFRAIAADAGKSEWRVASGEWRVVGYFSVRQKKITVGVMGWIV
jgi:hypothetical protein